MPTPTTVKFQFDTFASKDSGAVWTSPGNAEDDDGNFATADLSGVGATTSQLLVATGADLSSIPARAVVQSVKVNIKGKVTGGAGSDARIHEIFAWDGSAVQGRNQAEDFDMSPNSPVELNGTNTVYTRGAAGWLWWWIERLKDSSNGVAIRAERISGGPTVEIDHIEFEITYIELFQKTPIVDYRPIAYDRVAGAFETDDLNEMDEAYSPGHRPNNGPLWHDDSINFLETLIAERSQYGLKRIVFGTPAGDIIDDQVYLVASAQWEPMFDDQRVALTKVIPEWLAADPEREAIVYLGTWLNKVDSLEMDTVRAPDVAKQADVDQLKRTLFPYRDLVGVRRFFFDNSTAINRPKARALFEWGRENGMEFIMEAIPFVNNNWDVLDETITEVYGAFAAAGFVIGDERPTVARDPDLEWAFTKGRLLVQVPSGHFSSDLFDTPQKRRAFFQQFAREGYVLMPRDANQFLDKAGAEVAAEHIGRGVSFPVASSVSSGVSNSVTRFAERPRTRSPGSGR